MREMKEIEERAARDPVFRAQMARERQLEEERMERRQKSPKRPAVRKETIARIRDYYWHVARRRDDSTFIHRMDSVGKQGHGGSIDDAINFLLDEMERTCGYSKW